MLVHSLRERIRGSQGPARSRSRRAGGAIACLTAIKNYLEREERLAGKSGGAVVESEWPELAHKLPPKKPQGGTP